MTVSATRRDATALLAGCSLLFVGGASWMPGPESPVLCPLRFATGLPCPTCGLGRSVCLALHGELAGSLSTNPAGLLLLLLALCAALAAAQTLLGGSLLARLRPLAAPALALGLVLESLSSWPPALASALQHGLTSALAKGFLTRPLLELLDVL